MDVWNNEMDELNAINTPNHELDAGEVSPTGRWALGAVVLLLASSLSSLGCTRANPELFLGEESGREDSDTGTDGDTAGQADEHGGEHGSEDGGEDRGPGADTDTEGGDGGAETETETENENETETETECTDVEFGFDPECSECLQETCCDAVQACAEDSGCACVFSCLSEGTPALGCLLECEIGELLEPKLAIDALQSCITLACEGSCELQD